MKILRKSWMFLALLSLLFSTPVWSQERSLLSEVAVRQSVGLYESGGMSALRVNSQDCYMNILDKIFCFYLDLVAQEIDAKWTSEFEGPVDSYFENENVFSRIKPTLVTYGMTINDANDFLRRVQNSVKGAFEKSL